jgi:hypothetical protein
MKQLRLAFLACAAIAVAVGLYGCAGESSGTNGGGPQALLLLSTNSLQRINLSTGELVGNPIPLSQPLDSIAIRPNFDEVMGFGDDTKLYTINLINGVCSPVSAAPTGISTNGAGMTFDMADNIRYVDTDEDNFVIDPDSGTLATTDTDFAFQAADPNFGNDPNLVGCAYEFDTNSFFALDAANDILVRSGNVPSGQIQTIGALGTDFGGNIGFSVDQDTGRGYAVCTGTNSGLYRVDLSSGTAFLISNAISAKDIAVIP